jgi:arginase
MTHPDSSPAGGSDHDGVNLRLLWPQWQGAGTSSVEAFASEFPLDVARRGYAVGTAVPRCGASSPTSTGPWTSSGSRSRSSSLAR